MPLTPLFQPTVPLPLTSSSFSSVCPPLRPHKLHHGSSRKLHQFQFRTLTSPPVSCISPPSEATSGSAPPPPPPSDGDPQNQSTHDLLAAFEAAVERMEQDLTKDVNNPKSSKQQQQPLQFDGDEENLSPSDRRRLARERAEAEARAAHNRRLEVLTSLPAELVVAPATNTCPGCGVTMQSTSPDLPGYLPPERANAHSAEDQSQNPVCQRCYRLTHYGAIKPGLRVKTRRSTPTRKEPVEASKMESSTADSGEKVAPEGELTPERFKRCLSQLRGLNAVVIYLVDIFDFHGSLIPSLRSLIGARNPVLLALNKIDLLPRDFKPERVESWVMHEAGTLGLAEVAGLHLVSSRRGTGLRVLLADAVRLAKARKADVYVVGAANVGKSSFINQLISLRRSEGKNNGPRGGVKDNMRRAKATERGALTTSVIPGTTLDVIKIPLGPGINLFDTPGLMVDHQITNMLEPNDLAAVVPAKSVQCTTLRIGEGKTLFVGGLARIEVLSGRPFFFSCFFSADVKVHPGKSEGATEFVAKHVGQMLTPPFSSEGLERLGEWTSKSFSTEGTGWKKASVDIVLSGLGWVGLTGAGPISVRIWVPKGVGVFTRDPLMPYEIKAGVSTYTGTRSVNRRKMRQKASRFSD